MQLVFIEAWMLVEDALKLKNAFIENGKMFGTETIFDAIEVPEPESAWGCEDGYVIHKATNGRYYKI